MNIWFSADRSRPSCFICGTTIGDASNNILSFTRMLPQYLPAIENAFPVPKNNSSREPEDSVWFVDTYSPKVRNTLIQQKSFSQISDLSNNIYTKILGGSIIGKYVQFLELPDGKTDHTNNETCHDYIENNIIEECEK